MKKFLFILVFILFRLDVFAFQDFNESKFLNFSDVHFDPFYDSSLVKKLAASDYKEWEDIFSKSEIKTLSTYGSDSNFPLLISVLQDVKSRMPSPDFIVITGDFLGHNFYKGFKKYFPSGDIDTINFISNCMKFVTTMITKYFPLTAIFPSVGNDDSYCGNYMIEPGGDFLKMVSEIWEPLVNKDRNNESFQKTFSKGGYAELNLSQRENYKMIILNTIFFSSGYKNQCGDTLADPGSDELNWLKEKLQECRNNGYKVWLSYHIPPGIDIFGTINGDGNCEEKIYPTWKSKYNDEFTKIITEYAQVININLAGHFHRDDFRIFYNEGNPVSYIHLTPSISPIYGNNPAYQIVQYDSVNYGLLDYDTYYLKNLTLPDSVYWTLEYNFRNVYNQNYISPASLSNISDLIFSDSTFRAEYSMFYTTSNPNVFKNNYTNWFYNWCGFGHLTKEDYAKCLCGDTLNFKK
jgi:sphingomyelin phosphodiesterase acid-like 3